MKILFITPHLSTGGAPQYLLRKIQELHTEHDVYCIEYSNVTGGVLIVQRSQIESILGDRLITLYDDKFELINHIDNINPDVIHFEELPEYFCDNNLAGKIYSCDRKYKIIETSHDSSFDVTNKRFFPDRFVFVSNYQKQLFESLQIPADVVEYPIEYKEKKDRTKSLLELGLDPNKTHFLNVGLFTPRKNQAEIIEYARSLINENVQFHFVGNQADNFKYYWEPLMRDFPSNCKWWGERRDVDTFYNAMDVFLFTSKGTITDKETNPLVIREAIGWKMPILMYNLPVYMGVYDDYQNISWLIEDYNNNINIIKSKFVTTDSSKNFDELFDVIFESELNKFNINYKKIEPLNCSIVFKDVDSNASIYYFNAQFENYLCMWAIPLPTVVYSFINQPSMRGVKLEVYDENKKLITYKDIYIKDVPKTRSVTLDLIDPFDCVFNNYNEMFVHCRYDSFKFEKYLDVVLDVGANSGLFTKMCLLKGAKQIFSIEPNVKCLQNLKHMMRGEDKVIVIDKAIAGEKKKVKFYVADYNSTIGSFFYNHVNREHKNVRELDIDCITIDDVISEYNLTKITMLKLDVEGGEYEILYSLTENTFNKIDSILLEYHSNDDRKIIPLVKHLEKFGYSISGAQNQADSSLEDVRDNYADFGNGTLFLTKNLTNFKIKLVHLQTTLNDDREIASRKSLEPLKECGIDYVLHTNELYTSLPPVHTSERPTDVSIEKKNSDSLTPAHYGCYESFKLGILSEFDTDLEYLLVCEGDCLLETTATKFVNILKQVVEIMDRENIDYFSFGDTKTLEFGNLQSNMLYKPDNQDICYVTDRIIGLQCIMFSKRIRKTLFEYLRTAKWDASDIYFNNFCWEKNIKRAILIDRITTQCDGYSILDKTYKKFI